MDRGFAAHGHDVSSNASSPFLISWPLDLPSSLILTICTETQILLAVIKSYKVPQSLLRPMSHRADTLPDLSVGSRVEV